MTIKDKMKTYNFWISLVSAVLLLVRIIGDNYGFQVDSALVMDITTGVCGIFVILGIISVPQKSISSVKNPINNGEVSMNDKVLEYNSLFIDMNKKMQNNNISTENICINEENKTKNDDLTLTTDVGNIDVSVTNNGTSFVDACSDDCINVEENKQGENLDVINNIQDDKEECESNIIDLQATETQDKTNEINDKFASILATLSPEDIESLKKML